MWLYLQKPSYVHNHAITGYYMVYGFISSYISIYIGHPVTDEGC